MYVAILRRSGKVTLLVMSGILLLVGQVLAGPATASAHASDRSLSSAAHRRPALVQPNSSLPNSCSAQPGTLCEYPGDNWDGNEAVQSNHQRGIYRIADVEFYVPKINTNVSQAMVSLWAGVGGDQYVTNPAVLVQAGVFSQVRNGSQFNESWWEIVPYFGVEDLPLCRLAIGDHIAVHVASNLNNDGQDFFSINNYTAGCVADCTIYTSGPYLSVGTGGVCNGGVTGSTSYNSDSASGECIAETPYNTSTSYYPLAEWTGMGPGEGLHTVTLRGCLINGTAIGNQSHFYSQIENYYGTKQLAACGPIVNYGQDFNVVWQASQ